MLWSKIYPLDVQFGWVFKMAKIIEIILTPLNKKADLFSSKEGDDKMVYFSFFSTQVS